MNRTFNIITYVLCVIGIFSLGFPIHELVHYLTMDNVERVCIEFGSGNVATIIGINKISHPELMAYTIQSVFSLVLILVFTLRFVKEKEC